MLIDAERLGGRARTAVRVPRVGARLERDARGAECTDRHRDGVLRHAVPSRYGLGASFAGAAPAFLGAALSASTVSSFATAFFMK